MLVLSRKESEKLILYTETGKRIELTVCEIMPGRVRLGILAVPTCIQVYREEILPDHLREKP